jgi:hypothetical protein
VPILRAIDPRPAADPLQTAIVDDIRREQIRISDDPR